VIKEYICDWFGTQTICRKWLDSLRSNLTRRLARAKPHYVRRELESPFCSFAASWRAKITEDILVILDIVFMAHRVVL